jgi:hypothetical protein
VEGTAPPDVVAGLRTEAQRELLAGLRVNINVRQVFDSEHGPESLSQPVTVCPKTGVPIPPLSPVIEQSAPERRERV